MFLLSKCSGVDTRKMGVCLFVFNEIRRGRSVHTLLHECIMPCLIIRWKRDHLLILKLDKIYGENLFYQK